MNRFLSFNADFFGFLTAIGCAVHCLALPFIFSIGLVQNDAHHHAFDIAIVVLGVVFAGYSLVKGYIKHSVKTPMLIGFSGLILLFIGLTDHSIFNTIASVSGGSFLAFGHYINWKLDHRH